MIEQISFLNEVFYIIAQSSQNILERTLLKYVKSRYSDAFTYESGRCWLGLRAFCYSAVCLYNETVVRTATLRIR